MRVTDRGEEVWNESASRLTKSRYEAVPYQGEHAEKCEAFVVKDGRRRFGGCAEKDRVLTWGDLALYLKG